MERVQFSTYLVSIIFVLPAVLFSACSTPREGVRGYPTTPDEQSERVVWKEEIRAGDRTRVLGFLEKHVLQPANKPGSRAVYYIYNRNYEEVSEGFVLDTGRVYRHKKNGQTSDLGILGLVDGVKEVLNHSGEVTFFRQGKQVFHQ